ncbi:hypothetical protein GGI12_000559 [Dipsacomyces acuminosporus]|nr:hypothetical protein GGI12_000559 [Dipsacomyces acuminosporus]
MDIDTVRMILCDLDLEKYHLASKQKLTGEEVWPPSVEDAFLSAVHVFASVGQRKYQIDERTSSSNNVDLVGRNDIISRYIYMKTDKYRTRKQVSSHIQVWAHCKKPPSSRNMDMNTFQELQTVFRMYYSRPTTEFGQPKKKIRRVVSTSNVPASMQFSSGSGLGIEEPALQAESDTSSQEKKRGAHGPSKRSAKRSRRVVSELPSSLTASLAECTADEAAASPFGQGMQSTWAGQIHEPQIHNSIGDDANNQPGTPVDPLLAYRVLSSHTPVPVHAPMFFQPPFEDAIQPGACSNSSNNVASCGSPSFMPTHNQSLAVSLTAVAISAMSGFDESLGSPMHSSPQFIQNPAYDPLPLAHGIPSGVLPFSAGAMGSMLPASEEDVSAFASAAVSSNYQPEAMGNPFAVDGSHEFPDTLKKYYTDAYLTDASAGCVPLYEWSKAAPDTCEDEVCTISNAEGLADPNLVPLGASDAVLAVPAAAELAETDITANNILTAEATSNPAAELPPPSSLSRLLAPDPMPEQCHLLSAESGSNKEPHPNPNVATSSLAIVYEPGFLPFDAADECSEQPSLQAATIDPASICRSSAASTEVTDSNSTAAGTPAPCTSSTPSSKSKTPPHRESRSKPGKAAKEPRSSTSCTQSPNSGSKDCDAATVAYCSSPSTLPLAAVNQAVGDGDNIDDDDGHGRDDGGGAGGICRQMLLSGVGYSESQVAEWLSSLGSMLEAHGMHPSMHGSPSSSLHGGNSDDWYSVITRYLQGTG